MLLSSRIKPGFRRIKPKYLSIVQVMEICLHGPELNIFTAMIQALYRHRPFVFQLPVLTMKTTKKNGAQLPGQNKLSPIHKIRESGKYPLVIDDHLNIKQAAPSFLMFNAGHIENVNSSDPKQLTNAMIKGRKIANQLHEGLREFAPAVFANSYLAGTGALPGIREGRRIKGDYVFKVEDWLERRSFDDEIGRNSYYIDVHKQDAKRYARYKKGESHGIPYRCLTPKGLKKCFGCRPVYFGRLPVIWKCSCNAGVSGHRRGRRFGCRSRLSAVKQ